MLKKFEELNDEQKSKVKVMYSDLDTLKQYLYNFDDNGDYRGRQYAPPSGKDEKVGLYGVVHAESTVPDEEQQDLPEPDEEADEIVEKPKTRRRKGK